MNSRTRRPVQARRNGPPWAHPFLLDPFLPSRSSASNHRIPSIAIRPTRGREDQDVVPLPRGKRDAPRAIRHPIPSAEEDDPERRRIAGSIQRSPLRGMKDGQGNLRVQCDRNQFHEIQRREDPRTGGNHCITRRGYNSSCYVFPRRHRDVLGPNRSGSLRFDTRRGHRTRSHRTSRILHDIGPLDGIGSGFVRDREARIHCWLPIGPCGFSGVVGRAEPTSDRPTTSCFSSLCTSTESPRASLRFRIPRQV